MPRRRSSKKTSPTKPTETPSHPAPTPTQPDSVERLFSKYASQSSGMIEPQGVESLCSDLGLDPMDVRVLMLAWKMQAKTQGYFTLEEWQTGLTGFKANTIMKLKESLVELEKEVNEPANFAELYSYAFRYCLTEERQRTVEVETVCILMELLLRPKYQSQVKAVVEYLKGQGEYKVITSDQWMGFYRFITQIDFTTFDNYDSEVNAWPCIIDDVVDWIKEKQG